MTSSSATATPDRSPRASSTSGRRGCNLPPVCVTPSARTRLLQGALFAAVARLLDLPGTGGVDPGRQLRGRGGTDDVPDDLPAGADEERLRHPCHAVAAGDAVA